MHHFTVNAKNYSLRITVGHAMTFRPSTGPTVDLLNPETVLPFLCINNLGKIELLQAACQPELDVTEMAGEELREALEALEKEVDFFFRSLNPDQGEILSAGMEQARNPHEGITAIASSLEESSG